MRASVCVTLATVHSLKKVIQPSPNATEKQILLLVGKRDKMILQSAMYAKKKGQIGGYTATNYF